MHCNNSRDEFGSGADRHANFDSGTIDPQALLDVVRAAGAPVVCETPEPGLADDVAWLQARIDGSAGGSFGRVTDDAVPRHGQAVGRVVKDAPGRVVVDT